MFRGRRTFGGRGILTVAFPLLTPLLTPLTAEGATDPVAPDTAARKPIGEHPGEIPYFARKFGAECADCHVVPAKLNERGQDFVDRGYRIPGVEPASTVPLAVWASGRLEAPSGAAVDPPVHVNRVELISGGSPGPDWLSYFVEWRMVSLESRADGSLRDRSGRFEDLVLMARPGSWELMVGQFRQLQQVDVSRRLSLGEPLVVSSSLPGTGGGTERRRSLRGFAPSGRSPSVRVGRATALPGDWAWTAAAAVPLPGELSLPLTREAREEASNEIEFDPKGVFLESFVRRGLTSFGVHAFYDDPRRYMVNGVATAPTGPVHWEAMAGAARIDDSLRGRWSLQAEYFPHRAIGLGGRVEDRAGDGENPALLPYVNLHFPGTRFTFRLTVEHRIRAGRDDVTLIELAPIF